MALATKAYINGVGYTVKRASFQENTAASHDFVAAVTGKQIVVLNMTLVSQGTVVASVLSGSTGLMSLVNLAAGVPLTLSCHGNPTLPPIVTTAGEALKVQLAGAVLVSGTVTYIEV